jgi:putative spermidine/putrescine transport system substrate-binding protein
MARVGLVLVMLAALVVGACGNGREDPDPGPKVTPPRGVRPAKALGPSEGELNLLAPAGYVPPAATRGYGCDVKVTPAGSGDEVVRKLSTGRYDGALGNGDATIRLISGGAIGPINTDLVPNYEDVHDGLKLRPFNSVGGQMFALPVGRATQLMVWRRNTIPGTIVSLGAVLDRTQAASYGEQIIVPDDPATIAEAARWIGRQRKELEIDDPYELDRTQFNAALDVLRHQQPYVTEYWRDPGAVREAFRSGRASIGIAPQQVVGELIARPGDGGPIEATRLREGATGISPAWMIAEEAEHPNCMYRFLNRVLDPAVDATVALNASIAPANSKSCDVLEERGNDRFCDLFHADDDDYYAKTLFRTTPSADCGDARGRVCMDWEDWVRGWKKVVSGS